MLESLPVIHDPLFYAVAVPAALLIGLSKSGFASGFGALSTSVPGSVAGLAQMHALETGRAVEGGDEWTLRGDSDLPTVQFEHTLVATKRGAIVLTAAHYVARVEQ